MFSNMRYLSKLKPQTWSVIRCVLSSEWLTLTQGELFSIFTSLHILRVHKFLKCLFINELRINTLIDTKINSFLQISTIQKFTASSLCNLTFLTSFLFEPIQIEKTFKHTYSFYYYFFIRSGNSFFYCLYFLWKTLK